MAPLQLRDGSCGRGQSSLAVTPTAIQHFVLSLRHGDISPPCSSPSPERTGERWFTVPNKKHTAMPRQLGVEPGSFIYTVKVTSKFLRLARLQCKTVTACGEAGRQWCVVLMRRPSKGCPQVAALLGAWPTAPSTTPPQQCQCCCLAGTAHVALAWPAGPSVPDPWAPPNTDTETMLRQAILSSLKKLHQSAILK